MTVSSIGDLARSFMLRNQTTVLKTELDRRAFESTTGRVQDTGRAVKGDFTSLNGIDGALTRLAAYRTSTSEAKTFADGMQVALESLGDMAQTLSSTLLLAASPGNQTSLATAGRDARERFDSAVATLNSRIGDRSLFAGTETRRSALAQSDVILDALDMAVAGLQSADAVSAALDAWFSDPAGFETVAYRGGPPLDPIATAPGETVSLAATAADPGLRETLKGLAMGALVDRGILLGNVAEQAHLARRAGETLLGSASPRTELAARLGIAQERIASAETRNAAEATSLRIVRSALVEVDGYEAASALTRAEGQLDTLYAVTARLSRLSLANYL